MKKLTRKQIVLIALMLIATVTFIFMTIYFIKYSVPSLKALFETVNELEEQNLDTSLVKETIAVSIFFQIGATLFYAIALWLSITIFKQEKAKCLPLPRTEDN